MSRKFRSIKKEWPNRKQWDLINHYNSMYEFMLQEEEYMTISEADRNWKKLEELELFIKSKFGVSPKEIDWETAFNNYLDEHDMELREQLAKLSQKGE